MTQGLLDTLLERTVVPSFSSMGSAVRRRLFNWRPLKEYDLSDQIVVITGATSGIGQAAAEVYASLGAHLVIVARNADKTRDIVEQLKKSTGNNRIDSVIADLGQLSSVREACAELNNRYDRIDTLAHNAGALFNQRRLSDRGIDLTVELMVTAPFLMTGLCLPLPQKMCLSRPASWLGRYTRHPGSPTRFLKGTRTPEAVTPSTRWQHKRQQLWDWCESHTAFTLES